MNVYVWPSSDGAKLLRYRSKPGESVVIETNLTSSNVQAALEEWRAIARLRPRRLEAYTHIAITSQEGRYYSDDEWRGAWDLIMCRTGMSSASYLMRRHIHNSRDHLDIAINQVQSNGSVVTAKAIKKTREFLSAELRGAMMHPGRLHRSFLHVTQAGQALLECPDLQHAVMAQTERAPQRLDLGSGQPREQLWGLRLRRALRRPARVRRNDWPHLLLRLLDWTTRFCTTGPPQFLEVGRWPKVDSRGLPRNHHWQSEPIGAFMSYWQFLAKSDQWAGDLLQQPVDATGHDEDTIQEQEQEQEQELELEMEDAGDQDPEGMPDYREDSDEQRPEPDFEADEMEPDSPDPDSWSEGEWD